MAKEKDYQKMVDHMVRLIQHNHASHPLFITFTFREAEYIDDTQINWCLENFVDQHCSKSAIYLATIERHADLRKHVHAIFLNEPTISTFNRWQWGKAHVEIIKTPIKSNLERVANYNYKDKNWENSWATTYYSNIKTRGTMQRGRDLLNGVEKKFIEN